MRKKNSKIIWIIFISVLVFLAESVVFTRYVYYGSRRQKFVSAPQRTNIRQIRTAPPKKLEVFNNIETKDLFKEYDKTIKKKNFFGFLNFNINPLSHLTGENMPSGTKDEIPVIVMIDNHGQARPFQKSVERASVVYEAEAEGGITRLMAVFYLQKLSMIGPVRSARPYFISWANEYGGGFAHAGGSDEALEELKINGSFLNIDDEEITGVFYRDNTIARPHNLYTNSDRVLSVLKKSKYFVPLTRNRFLFKKSDKRKGNVRYIEIFFANPKYFVEYRYKEQKNTYDRYDNSKRHGRISPSNVIVQVTDWEVMDEKERINLRTTGTGEAVYFMDGKRKEGVWWKKDEKSLTYFFDKDYAPMRVNKGKTWIEAVRSSANVQSGEVSKNVK